MRIRRARLEDGADAMQVLRASITQLCVDDHHNRAALLTPWLANKTAETFQIWLENPERILLVAEQDGSIAGIGMASTEGEIMLNYVAPNKRFNGVSSHLLDALEQSLSELGQMDLHLMSTQTAHAFYQSRGWSDSGPPIEDAGMFSFPMQKSISLDRSA